MRGATTQSLRLTIVLGFQSTHLMRGATANGNLEFFVNSISIHAPHARCDAKLREKFDKLKFISIHAPHARCDAISSLIGFAVNLISIHAPHARCDKFIDSVNLKNLNFNPRTSCEVRHDVLKLSK